MKVFRGPTANTTSARNGRVREGRSVYILLLIGNRESSKVLSRGETAVVVKKEQGR